jgi:hypothetical protein
MTRDAQDRPSLVVGDPFPIEDSVLEDPRRVTPETDPKVTCSKCLWNCAYRSRRQTGLDLFLALFFLRPFRCRSCRKRYYRLSFS